MIRKNNSIKTFNIGTFALAFGGISLMTWISFFLYVFQGAAQISNESIILNLLTKSFLIFRLPLHALIDVTIEQNTLLFVWTLFMNPIFWSLLIERIVFTAKRIRIEGNNR
jgi:hypothetical protein